VNGDYVRNELSKQNPQALNFTQGDNWMHSIDYKNGLINKDGEIWVDNALKPQDQLATVLHEVIEPYHMMKGKDYETSHEDYANPAELKVRHAPYNPESIIKKINAKEAKLNKLIAEVSTPETNEESDSEDEEYAVSKKQRKDYNKKEWYKEKPSKKKSFSNRYLGFNMSERNYGDMSQFILPPQL
jgi:hypothetical protein